MANIRDLKKDINNLCFEVISECAIFQYYSSSLFFENVQEIIEESVELRNELIFKVNHPPLTEDKKAVKAHYRSIVDELFEKTIALIERLNSLPDELKGTKEKSPGKKKNMEAEEDHPEEAEN